MKIYSYIILVLFCFLVSCKDDEAARLEANAKDSKKNEQIFASIDKSWNFNTPSMNPSVANIIENWDEWRLFMTELNQKPKSSIGAFQQKAKTLSKRVIDLNNHIPAVFDKPEVRSRIMTLATKVRSLDLYINLSHIQEQKVIKLIPEINEELASLTSQMDEIVKKSQIRLEEGEAEMLQSLGKDSLKTPQPPSEQPKPSNTTQQGGIIPHHNPKQKSQ
ncbi:hypothetical protein CLV94_1566 [Flavobacterium endophyticum]|uniref:Lipoprotein n=1 Tax=Flavobacterium endophyticum TaxID=1540163 RepID=A0A495MM55_9FLAO|nr:hypothetical protein [Flavobacterium endophyticum]RKS26508.1 hypothetical protein CLV94_1566 [Flavobacterium endophyticum]